MVKQDEFSLWGISDNSRYPVFVVHWWPGRVFSELTEIPPFAGSVFKRARESGSLYATVVWCETPEKVYFGMSRCMCIDQPKRKYGLNRALGLLCQSAIRDGYMLCRGPNPMFV